MQQEKNKLKRKIRGRKAREERGCTIPKKGVEEVPVREKVVLEGNCKGREKVSLVVVPGRRVRDSQCRCPDVRVWRAS